MCALTRAHQSCISSRAHVYVCARVYVCVCVCVRVCLCMRADPDASTFSGYSAIVDAATATSACPASTCTLSSRGNNVETLVQCDQLTYDFFGTKLDEPGRRCGAYFHADCNIATKLTVPAGAGGQNARIAIVQHQYGGRDELNLCFEHRAAHSDAARGGHRSQSICSVLCGQHSMGVKYDARCSHVRITADGKQESGCSAYFHRICMDRSSSSTSDAQGGADAHSPRPLYCLGHLPADCAFILDQGNGALGQAVTLAPYVAPTTRKYTSHASTSNMHGQHGHCHFSCTNIVVL